MEKIAALHLRQIFAFRDNNDIYSIHIRKNNKSFLKINKCSVLLIHKYLPLQ